MPSATGWSASYNRPSMVQFIDWKDGFHTELDGKNGGGDPWHTDGRLAIVTLRGSSQAACKAR